MESLVGMFLWAWIILESGVRSISLPEITDKKFMEQCVREHNRARSSVSPPASNMLYMTWDEGLAAGARAWARNCLFEHNDRRAHPSFASVGENIWTGYPPSTFDVRRAVNDSWVGEKSSYSYESNACTRVCGHYTQVVWADSYMVGCAAQLCPRGVRKTTFATREAVIFVCNYATAGNVVGMRPYESKGPACSGCDGTCVENLCRSKGRDAPTSNNRTPDWEPAPADHSYVAVLVVRPLALASSFIIAYALHHFYPNVFCYE